MRFLTYFIPGVNVFFYIYDLCNTFMVAI